MEQVLRVTPVVGLPQFNGWSHVWELSLDPQTKCVICIGIAGDNAGNIGRDITEAIAQMPPRSAQGLYQTLEDCIQLAGDQQGQLSIVGGVFKNKRSVLATYQGTILLKRGIKVGRIVQSDAELQIIEGKFDIDDVFVFATDAARQFLSQIELSFQRGYDSDGVITGIVPALHSLEDSATCGLAFVLVTEEDETQPQYVPPAMEIDFQTTVEEDVPLVSVEQASPVISTSEQVALPPAEGSEQKKPQLKLSEVIGGLTRVVAATKRVSKKAVTAVLQLQRIFSSKTYVGGPSAKKMITWAVVGGGVILLVLAVTWFIRTRLSQAEAEALETAAPYRSQLSQITAQAEDDPIPARGAASALIETIKNVQSEAEASGEKRTAQEMGLVLSEAQSAFQEISGRDEVNELPIFYDLRLVTSDFISSLATGVGGTAVFIDAEKAEAIVLDTQTKQVFKLDLSSASRVSSINSLGDDRIVVLANGVYSLSTTENASLEELKEEGDSNRDGTLIASYGSYLYVFNPAKRNIYRYVEAAEGYSDPVGWLLDPLGVPFDTVVSWAIDGDIWIGTEGGQVLRFASGRAQEFSVSGLPDAFSSALHVVTRENLENIFVLEPAQNRLVILNKEGQFLREVKSSSLGAATSLLVDSSGSTAYVVSGSTVFAVDAS